MSVKIQSALTSFQCKIRHLIDISLLSLLAPCLLLSCSENNDVSPSEENGPVQWIGVSSPQETLTRQFPGIVLTNKQADLSFNVSEKLIYLPVLEGMVVKKEQVLARVEPKKFINYLNEKKARFSLAKAQFARGKQLMKKKYISQFELDILKSKYQIALVNLHMAKRDLENTFLRAPFAGIVSEKYVDKFEFIEAHQPVLNLHTISQVDIEIFLPEEMMMEIHDNNTTEFMAIFPANLERKFPVKLKAFSSRAHPDTQTYRIVFTMDVPGDMRVLPGMRVTILATTPNI